MAERVQNLNVDNYECLAIVPDLIHMIEIRNVNGHWSMTSGQLVKYEWSAHYNANDTQK